jgi:hypothetical protein
MQNIEGECYVQPTTVTSTYWSGVAWSAPLGATSHVLDPITSISATWTLTRSGPPTAEALNPYAPYGDDHPCYRSWIGLFDETLPGGSDDRQPIGYPGTGGGIILGLQGPEVGGPPLTPLFSSATDTCTPFMQWTGDNVYVPLPPLVGPAGGTCNIGDTVTASLNIQATPSGTSYVVQATLYNVTKGSSFGSVLQVASPLSANLTGLSAACGVLRVGEYSLARYGQVIFANPSVSTWTGVSVINPTYFVDMVNEGVAETLLSKTLGLFGACQGPRISQGALTVKGRYTATVAGPGDYAGFSVFRCLYVGPSARTVIGRDNAAGGWSNIVPFT